MLFLSTLSLRRATNSAYGALDGASISIHALLAESDEPHQQIIVSDRDFYPRSPCGERHLMHRGAPSFVTISIHALLAESDVQFYAMPGMFWDFYPRSPCGERPGVWRDMDLEIKISIHALLAESDAILLLLYFMTSLFLSTLSLRRATCYSLRHSTQSGYFYPRSPCGERPRQEFYKERPGQFLSTLSLRRATESQPPCERPTTYFYPRSPCGERLNGFRHRCASFYFYPRSPCGERR